MLVVFEAQERTAVAWLVDGELRFDDARIEFAMGLEINPHPAQLAALGLDAATIQAIHDAGNAMGTIPNERKRQRSFRHGILRLKRR